MRHIFSQIKQTADVVAVRKLDFENVYQVITNWLLLNGPRIVIGIAVLLLGQWVIRLIKRWFQRKVLLRRYAHTSIEPFIESLILAALQVLLFLLTMQIMGVELTLFAAMVASFGVATGLALSGTLQNFACGLLIMFLKPFKVDDHILAQGHEGIVESIQIFYTVVTTSENKTVIIPNSKLSNEVIVKFPDKV